MIEVTCPSGLSGKMRGMKVKDEQLFNKKNLQRSGRTITELLNACWVETIDPGPYQIQDKFNWDSALISDRQYALIQLRIGTYGSTYEIDILCDSCNRKYGYNIYLDALDVMPVSDKVKNYVQTKRPIDVTLNSGIQLKCRPLDGADEAYFASLSNKEQERISAYHLSHRIVEAEGKESRISLLAYVEDMERMDSDELWDITDELEGGMETTLDTECPHCENIQETILPFERKFFSNRKRFSRR